VGVLWPFFMDMPWVQLIELPPGGEADNQQEELLRFSKMRYRAFSSMCEIVDAYPPKAEFAAGVAAQIRDSGCELSPSPGRSAWSTISTVACGVASEFSPPGTQHIVERACNTLLGNS